jgi:1-acylglycerone phosphate reductase
MSRKSVLITGCSEGGIGYNLALEWNKRGFRVFATARKVESMAGLEEVGIECLAMDVTDYASLKAVKEKVEKKTGGTLDILVNNAGQGTTLLTTS